METHLPPDHPSNAILVSLNAAQQEWVEATLRALSLPQKLGQMLMPFLFGGDEQKVAGHQAEIRFVEELGVGGFLLGAKTGPAGVEHSRAIPSAAVINELQRRAAVPLLVSADFEQGAGMRLEEGTHFPSAMAIAATGRPADAAEAARVTALESRAIGVNWIFAPVADVNINPENPIINIRSFGEDPASVGEFVAAFVRGAQEHGVLATAKHFPGHGDVTRDSHLELPVLRADRSRLESVEWVPFRAAIAAGVAAVMTGHLAVPAVEPDDRLPATLSPKLLQDVLRGELGFQGLIVADALDMGGIVARHSPEDAAVLAAAAGVDVLLLPPDPPKMLAALQAAVRDGRLSESRVDDAARRILSAKAAVFPHVTSHPPKSAAGNAASVNVVNVETVLQHLHTAAHTAAAQQITERGITLLRNSSGLIPLDAVRPARVLLVSLSGDPDPHPGAEFEAELRNHADQLTVVAADAKYHSAAALHLPFSSDYDVAILALFVRVADRKGTVALPEEHVLLARKLLAAGKPVIAASFGSPYLLAQFPDARNWIAAFSSVDACQRAAARAIYGLTAVHGKLPVAIPASARRGDGIPLPARPMHLLHSPPEMAAQLHNAFHLLERNVFQCVFPGGVLAVGLRNHLALHAFGCFTYHAGSPAVCPNTIFDVASLTKPVVTTTSVMQLFQAGQIDLDSPVSRYLPEWNACLPHGGDEELQRARRKQVTIRHLLLHTSGLPAHRDYFLTAEGKANVVNRVLRERLIAEPGSKIEYSDLGFILLGEIIERIAGEPLDRYAARRIFHPLGMGHSLFNPPLDMQRQIPPSENDSSYRRRLVQGDVHDPNAYAMGGVAGHAGLFSTAGDLAAFSQMMLNGGIYAHRRLLHRATIAEFTRRVTIGNESRALGWDVPTAPSASGRYFSLASYGHSGYTGASVWIDPDRDLFVILLTNRVYPSSGGRVGSKWMREIRAAVHDAVMEGLGFAAAATPPPAIDHQI